MPTSPPLQIIPKKDQHVQVGNNTLILLVRNLSDNVYEQLTLRFDLPAGITLPIKKTVASLPAHGEIEVSLDLYAAKAGTYHMNARASAFKPKGSYPLGFSLDIQPKKQTVAFKPVALVNINKISSRSFNDSFTFWERGLTQLKQAMAPSHPCYGEFLNYESQLLENIERARRYGPEQMNTARRAEIIEQLNRLAFTCLGLNFNDLCKLK